MVPTISCVTSQKSADLRLINPAVFSIGVTKNIRKSVKTFSRNLNMETTEHATHLCARNFVPLLYRPTNINLLDSTVHTKAAAQRTGEPNPTTVKICSEQRQYKYKQ